MQVMTELSPITCPECGMLFAIPEHLKQQYRDHGTFFRCPSGHSQHFTETTEQKLERAKRQLADEQMRREQAEANALGLQRRIERMETRAKSGVCQFCKRTFRNVRRHMDVRHKAKCA